MPYDQTDSNGEAAPGGVWQGRLASIAGLIAAILLVALVILVAMSMRERDAALKRERHSYDVMLVTRQLDASTARAEAALGRFVISGEKQTGALYYDEWKKARRQLRLLTQLSRDNPDQVPLVAELGRLYDQRGRELAEPATRSFYKQGWTALSMYYRAGRASSIVRIDTLLARIATNERDLLDVRSDRATSSMARANRLTGLLSLVGMLLVLSAGVLGWTTMQAIAQRSRARRDARLESDRAGLLEQAVAARTLELREANIRLREEADTREAAEAQLRQVQKMEAVGQLTGGIAHDFNNMLAVVVSGLDLARRRLHQEADEVGRHIENAMEGANRAAALTRRLLAFARAEPLLPEAVEPATLIPGMSDLLDRTLGERIRLETRIAPGGWPVWCDPHQLENAILNLAVNARDAMDEEGPLRIETGNVTLRAGQVGEAPAGDYVRIAVIDSGAGMSREVMDRVFEPFFTTKPVGKGTGLGLSQIFGFVRQSGGDIAIDSTPGRGTTVALYLPRHAAGRPAAAAPAVTTDTGSPAAPPGAPRPSGSAVILVVEDDARVRAATVAGLEEIGHQPLPCCSGEEAIALLDRRDDIAMIVTDVVMPGMTGPQLIAAIAPRHAHVPVLYVTGYVGEASDAAGFAGNAVLRKPFTVAGLDRAVNDALAGRTRHEAPHVGSLHPLATGD